ncbi:MAG: Uma2 family endonuclease [Emticicia sp.]
MATILDELKAQINLPQIIEEINTFWENEKKKRKEFYELVHENVSAEFINGEIIFNSPVKNKHWVACTNLSAYLTVYVNKQKLGRVGVEKVLIRCTRNDYEPDIVFFKNEKAQYFTADQMIFPAPDLAVEILSASTRTNDYGIKFIDYASHGVSEYWIIDTDQQSVEQYLLKNGEYTLHQKLSENGKLKSLAIVGFELDVEAIFV